MGRLTDFISYSLFPVILNMSLTASLVILFVMLCRRFLKNAPKIFSYALWAVVLFRLLCPFSFSSEFSLLGLFDPPSLRSESSTVSMAEHIPTNIVHTAYPRVEIPLLPEMSESINESLPSGAEQTVADPLEAPMSLTTLLWLWGIGIFLIYSVVSYLKLRFRLVGATHLRDNIRLADHITSPFVMGLFRPKIYLPSSLTEEERHYIILHEQHHIKRLDHIIKVLSFAALCIHWFNPLVWLAFVLSSKDMEMSCDEAVIKKLGPEIRADYSASLLTLATGKRIFSVTPLAFGEGDTGSRIKNLAKWKKAGKYVTFISLVAVVFVLVFCAANGTGKNWVKAEIGNGPTFSFTANLEQPIVSWSIYEDIYEEGSLISSTARLTVDIPKNAGSSERRFTGALQIDRAIPSNQVSVALTCFGTRSWHFTLPLSSYTGSGYAVYDGKTSSREKCFFNAGDDIILFSAVFSTNVDGGVTFPGSPTDITTLNHTVVQYRLATSVSPSTPPESTGSAEIPPPQSSGQIPASSSLQKWFDAFGSPSTAYPEEEQFMKMAAFPNTTFRITNDYRLIARKDGKDTVLIEGMPIWNVYLCDLNGDEKPEFCATIAVGSGMIDNRVIVYDYAAGESYSLDYRGLYDYALSVDGSLLCVTQTDYRTGEIKNTGPLRLMTTDAEGGSFLYIGELLQQLPLPAVDPLEEAISAAIKDHNRSELPDGLFRSASHVTLSIQTVYPGSYSVDSGYQSKQITAQISALTQSFSMSNGILSPVKSKFFPASITFEQNPSGAYTLVEYLEGTSTSASSDEYSLRLMQDCTSQAVRFAIDLGWSAWPEHLASLLEEVCSSPSYSSNYHDYIAAHPEQWQELLSYGQYSLHYCFSQFLEGGQTDLRGLVMATLCRQIMEGWGENFTTASLTAETGQIRFDVFMRNALELAKEFDNETLRTQFPGSWFLIEFLKESGSDSGSLSPLSNEFTFTHRISGSSLALGQFFGKFPWSTDLKTSDTKYWSSDGFDCFSFSCEDGTFLKGLRAEGSKDETDGNLLEIEIVTPEWETCRGAFVGMPLEHFLLLYPDASPRGGALDPGDHCYTYVEEGLGFNQLLFCFEENVLTTMIAANGIDGYLY